MVITPVHIGHQGRPQDWVTKSPLEKTATSVNGVEKWDMACQIVGFVWVPV